MKAAPLAAALVLLAGCRPAPAPSDGSSSAAPPSPLPPVVLVAEPAPSAEPFVPVASAVLTAAAAVPAPPPAPLGPAIVREEAKVTVDGVEEAWRIEWTAPPTDTCFDEMRFSCLCKGFTFAESGNFDIVRVRPGLKEQRLHREGTLPRWPELPADRDHLDVARVKKRPVVPLMRFDDYNHDGKKAEFVLQTGAGNPCGRTPAVLVGVNFNTNTLDVFGTGKSPGKPLELEHRSDWEKVKAAVPLTLIELSCGDHGAPNQISLVIDVKKGVFRAREVTSECLDDFSRVGKVIGAEDR